MREKVMNCLGCYESVEVGIITFLPPRTRDTPNRNSKLVLEITSLMSCMSRTLAETSSTDALCSGSMVVRVML